MKVILLYINILCFSFSTLAQSEKELSLLDSINTYRASFNLKPLILDTKHYSIAQDHNLYLDRKGVEPSHENFNKRVELVRNFRYGTSVAENICWCSRPFTSWKLSPHHNEVMLLSDKKFAILAWYGRWQTLILYE